MKTVLTAAIAAILLSATSLHARAADAKGVWLTADGEAKIRVADCAGKLCGTIVWLKRPFDPDTGKPSLDKQNPEAGKRTRPLIGVPILTGMHPTGTAQWAGPIYNADDGNMYEGKMTLLDASTLKIEGCAFGVCQGENWKRSH